MSNPSQLAAVKSRDPDELELLAGSEDPITRELVAQNAATRSNALVLLVSDRNPYIQAEALRHPHITAEVLLRAWERSSDDQVRENLLLIEACPAEVIAAALAPNVPNHLRQTAWEQILREPEEVGRYNEVIAQLLPDVDVQDFHRIMVGVVYLDVD